MFFLRLWKIWYTICELYLPGLLFNYIFFNLLFFFFSPEYTMVYFVSIVPKNYPDLPLLLCILCNRFCRRCLESIVGFPIKMWFVQILYCLHD